MKLEPLFFYNQAVQIIKRTDCSGLKTENYTFLIYARNINEHMLSDTEFGLYQIRYRHQL